MPTLLMTPRQTDDTQKLWRACIELGWRTERMHHWKIPAIDPAEAVIYAEPLLAQRAAETLGLKLLEPAEDWLVRLPGHFRGRDVELMRLDVARQISKEAFIKPATQKCFDAKVYRSGAELPAEESLSGEVAVLVQEVVSWEAEYRCFVADNQVLALSPYWRCSGTAAGDDDSWPATEEELAGARAFAAEVLNSPEVEFPIAAVLDVGISQDGQWAVVESNAAWGSGVYGCDPAAVLEVLRKATVPGN